MTRIIFHSPLLVEREQVSGSAIRPVKMLQAFKELGYEVIVIDGESSARRRAFEKLLASDLSDVIGLYSEFSTMPIFMCDGDRIPREFLLEYKFFNEMRRRGIPVSVFYRDVYWKFPKYNKAALWKKLIQYPLYVLELAVIKRSVDHLFLPHVKMSEAIGSLGSQMTISELPPGCDGLHDNTGCSDFSVFYVGGVSRPLYDITPSLQATKNADVEFVICCRESEWESSEGDYSKELSQNHTVIHKSGKEMQASFASASVLSMLFSPEADDYRRFAMPIKLFESIAFSVPVLAFKGTASGDFVEREALGWVVENVSEAADLLRSLKLDSNRVKAMRHNVSLSRNKHTWVRRAEAVIEKFNHLKKK